MATKLTLRNQWLARYAAALAAVAAGLLLRLGLTALVGEGLPTYITFYPVIMAVALLGGEENRPQAKRPPLHLSLPIIISRRCSTGVPPVFLITNSPNL